MGTSACAIVPLEAVKEPFNANFMQNEKDENAKISRTIFHMNKLEGMMGENT